ncbi:MAG: family 43 glycosylhydrolase [Oscillospiraceae bacterium]|nr:family 43 glycosylhydrolase [Oscillospiraceae bacterium]
MQTIIKKVLSLALVLVILGTILAACSEEKSSQVQYEVPNYQGQLEEGQTKSDYNKELFYRNDKKTSGADPFILDNTQVDGYYYQYVTSGSLFCYRSKNLMDWEPVGNTLDNLEYADDGSQTEFRRVTDSQMWAPEVVYDSDTETYYMFFSATSAEDTTVKVAGQVEEGHPYEMTFVATSQYPDRDFQLVNFKDAASCGQENLHTYNEAKYPHYFAKYLMFDCEAYRAFSDSIGGSRTEGYGGYVGGIDPHPYIDENGDKYLFWVDSRGSDRIVGVKMENWLKPDWSTAQVLTYHSYYTVADYQAEQAGQYVDKVTYEPENHSINEGPQVIAHNGKYYLTFSVGNWADSSYQVAQAVADNILGPYRKLTGAEGGVLISGSIAGSEDVSGTGHHTMLDVGGKLYIVYHRHDDFVTAGANRNAAIDEVKWITIKDKDGNDLEVMYTNGPTCTVQPKIEAFADYVNIAPEAKISGGKHTEYLNDGLLSVYKYADPAFLEYIQETMIQKTTTFTFDFEQARPVRAVMVYNSKMETSCFQNISHIEFICEENGKEVVRYIDDVAFSSEYYSANDLDGTIYYVKLGAAAYAEFDELNVKTVKITVEVPKGQESVGISEIRILGK